MATLQLTFPSGSTPSAVVLNTLTGSPAATTSLPLSFVGPTVNGDSSTTWVATFAGAAILYAYTATATINSVPETFPGNVGGDGSAASGYIIDQSTLTTFLGSINLAIQTNQDNSATLVNMPALQSFINSAESYVFARLGEWFTHPPTVSGVALKSASGTIALPLLQKIAHQLCGFDLNKWRAIQSLPDQESGSAVIDQVAKAWEADAAADLNKIVRWAWGYSDGLMVDLDFVTGAARGAPVRVVQQPTFAGPCVDHNGLPDRKIINPAGVAWPSPWRFLPE